jgi:hypothetical protein
MVKLSNSELAHKAIEYVIDYEKNQGRNAVDVSREGVGYDVRSDNRFIEVKGKIEGWKSYNWQQLYKSEVDCLKQNTDSFYLYIVRFEENEIDLYIIPGKSLLDNFKITPEVYRLSPISKRKLAGFIAEST